MPGSEGAQIALGDMHGCGVFAGSELRCWGSSDFGETGSSADSDAPSKVAGIGPVLAVAVGAHHSCAILTDRTVVCFGDNSNLQLGTDAKVLQSIVPIPVVGLFGAQALALGDGHSCALLTTGEIRCWGTNTSGQLGDGTHVSRRLPAPVLW